MTHVVTFTNLFPSAVQPTHGLFVRERMRRVAAAGGFQWTVVAPVPGVPWPLRFGRFRALARVPRRERLDDGGGAGGTVDAFHPRFFHLPGLSARRQADRVARGARAALRELMARADRQVVLDAHYLWPDGVAAATLAAELGVPFTLTARGSDVNVLAQDPVIAARIADAARRAGACMAVSDALARRFAEVAGLPRERVVTVRNGVDLERFHPGDRRAARRELGLPPEGRVVLGIGRLVEGKGFAAAARAVARLDATQLVLVGDGPEGSAIAQLGGDRVTLLGTADPDRVALCCRAADALVLPSHREGWPNVVTEALASGLPVVATRVGGIPQILDAVDRDPEPWLGALVEVGDDGGLGAALRRVLDTPPEPQRVRAFAERYGWQQPVQLLVDTFRRLGGEAAA